ncbi:MAG: alpha/beta fold hydrolase, partial [Bdellovibrionales bacterium]|nr:alpha/beta fold hydrolase [Bdellovibrionales bacterium]
MSIESSLQFTETMRGFFSENKNSLSFSQLTDQFSSCYDLGKNLNYPLDFTLTIKIQSIDAFCNDPDLQANAEGVIQCPRLGGELAVKKGLFNLFVRPSSSIEFNAAKEMHYLLHFLDKNGEQKTFFGFKVVDREDFVDIWPETTTLYTCIFDGFLSTAPQKNQIPSFVGILKIEVKDFIQQLQSFKTNQKDLSSRASVLAKFLSLFAGNLWEAYAPFIFGTEEQRWDEHIIALQSNEGVRGVEIQKRNVFTKDGLFLSMDRFHKKKSKNVVVLLHGLTTSTDMFIMPEHYNLVQYLLDHGYDDVWSLDWRGSSRHVYNLKPLHHTIDDVVLYDIPAALEHIKNEVGEDSSLHVICHCVGSISFMCALAAGKVSGVHSIISNSVSLTPQIRWQSKIKLSIGPNLLEYVFGYPYISPEIPFFPGPGFGRWIWWMERLLRRECKEPACHMISFMWGWGFPAAYEHDNLNVVTHRRLKDLFGGTNLHWYRHILKMVKNGQAL